MSRAATKVQHRPKNLSRNSSKPPLGAPAQHGQGSRKGKRAWRKNVDLQDLEEGLEGLRTEERITGSILQKKSDAELFQVDVQGDDKARRSLPKFSTSQLTSAKILAQRSAVPAVSSRVTAASAKKRKISHADKDRMLRTAKRPRKGPFGAIVDTSEFGAGSAALDVSDAVKQSQDGAYDVWTSADQPQVQVKAPPTTATHPRTHIEAAALPQPHQGTSYNPVFAAHQELLQTAHAKEEKRAQRAKKMEEWKEKMDRAKEIAIPTQEGVPVGMTVGPVEDDEETYEGVESTEAIPKKAPERKTKQQRAKAAKLKAEKLALAEKLARKRLLASVPSARLMRRSLEQKRTAREQAARARRMMTEQTLKRGLGGKKLGRHIVPEGEVDVQLGEDLSESLRQLKPEGNLFRDRFVSLQQRGLIEPRVLVVGKRRKAKMKEYEKHAWKRFE